MAAADDEAPSPVAAAVVQARALELRFERGEPFASPRRQLVPVQPLGERGEQIPVRIEGEGTELVRKLDHAYVAAVGVAAVQALGVDVAPVHALVARVPDHRLAELVLAVDE